VTTRQLLSLTEDELDAIQVRVRLCETPQGIQILSNSLVDRLLAKQALERRGFTIKPTQSLNSDFLQHA
jgi:hypothetical protein